MFPHITKFTRSLRRFPVSSLLGLCLTISGLTLATAPALAADPAHGQADHFGLDHALPSEYSAPDPLKVVPTSPAPSHDEEELSETEMSRLRISSRYSDAVVKRFVQTVSREQALSLYREAMQLIDTRHLEPSSYQMRVDQAVRGLMMALENPEFLEANRLSLTPDRVTAFGAELNRLAKGRPVRNASDALSMLNATMELAQRQIGLRPTTVALEFVYGATDSLDKYSTFVPDDTAGKPSAAAVDDHVVGIGVEIKPNDKGVIVAKTLRGGPAAEAGLLKGDIIVSVNGKSLEGKNLNYAVELIGGPANSTLSVGVLRNGSVREVRLVRRRVTIYSVSEFGMIDEAAGVGYIKLDKFAQSSTEEVDKALWELYRKGMKSLVFDVRGNPGGLLTTAIELSDKFLPGGAIVSTRGRTSADNMAENAKREQTWKVPLVVLIDHNSASASEIFAAAIQENERGLVLGRQSYGKGTVQTHFPLRSVSGNLRLTTAKFYSPKGRQMAGAGVSPDIQIELTAGVDESYTAADRDIQAALVVAKNPILKQLSVAISERLNGTSQVMPLGS